MLTVLILVVFVVVGLVMILLAVVVFAIRAGTERRGDEQRGAKPDRRHGPADARGLLAQAYSSSRQPPGVADHRLERDDKSSIRRKEVRYRCRHTPSSR